jgi:hypothetical protein
VNERSGICGGAAEQCRREKRRGYYKRFTDQNESLPVGLQAIRGTGEPAFSCLINASKQTFVVHCDICLTNL